MTEQITGPGDPDVAKVYRLVSKSERCQLGPARELARASIQDHAGEGLDASEKPSDSDFRMQYGRVRGPGRTDTVTGSCANAHGH